MSLLVIGSIALDTIETPFGKAEYILGGSASYISTTASYFTDDIKMVGIVGYDFPKEELDFFRSKNIDTSGVVISKEQKTFHWHGKYDYDLNNRESVVTELNALSVFNPDIPKGFENCEYICLGNIDPIIQKKLIGQIIKPKLVMCDTMNFWIESKYDELVDTLSLVDVIVINDSEARELSREFNLVTAAKKIIEMGPRIVIIKKGEHGALLFTPESVFAAPAYPLEKVFDPTGAGDTFAGGFMGWISKTRDFSERNLKLAVIYGSTMASLAVEEFSLEGIRNISSDKIRNRYNDFKSLTTFEGISI
jgi:sugar/nucleoside kinase (ribokinase family)